MDEKFRFDIKTKPAYDDDKARKRVIEEMQAKRVMENA